MCSEWQRGYMVRPNSLPKLIDERCHVLIKYQKVIRLKMQRDGVVCQVQLAAPSDGQCRSVILMISVSHRSSLPLTDMQRPAIGSDEHSFIVQGILAQKNTCERPRRTAILVGIRNLGRQSFGMAHSSLFAGRNRSVGNRQASLGAGLAVSDYSEAIHS